MVDCLVVRTVEMQADDLVLSEVEQKDAAKAVRMVA